MGSIHPDLTGPLTFLFLVLVVSVTEFVSAQSPLKITEVKRQISTADDSKFTLYLGFEADTKPGVSWYTYATGGLQRTEFDWSTTEYNEKTKIGTTKLDVGKMDYGRKVYTLLGDLQGQFFKVRWNMRDTPSVELSKTINLAASSVDSGTDLSYTSGQDVGVTIVVQKDRGSGLVSAAKTFKLTGECLVGGKLVEVLSSSPPEWLVATKDESTASTSHIFSFKTATTIVNGYLYSFVKIFPTSKDSSPFSFIEEMFYLRVHENTNTGPFPNTFVSASLIAWDSACKKWNYNNPWDACHLYCYAYGNAIDKLEIIKKTKDGSSTVVSTFTSRLNPYSANTDLQLDNRNTQVKGTYVCKVTQGQASDEKSVSVTYISARAHITVLLEFKRLESGKLEVTCESSGTRPLTFKLLLKDNGGATEELDPSSPLDETLGMYTTATFTSKVISAIDAVQATCRAENEYSYDTRTDKVRLT